MASPYLPFAQNQLPGGQSAPGYTQQEYDKPLGDLAKRLIPLGLGMATSPTPVNVLLSLLGGLMPSNKYTGALAAATKEPGPLIESAGRELIPQENTPQTGNQVYIHSITRGDKGYPSYVNLSQKQPLSEEDFQNAFFPEGSLPDKTHVNVAKMKSAQPGVNRATYRLDFYHENKGGISAPVDLHKYFGADPNMQNE